MDVRKTPTIQDVAKHACVSTATVSRALSKPEHVSEEMRGRVHAAVRATGYTVNLAARSLRKRLTKTILVAVPDIGNTFFSVIIDAIEREATSRGYGVLVTNRVAGEDSNKILQHYFQSNRADGLLLFDGNIDVSALRPPTGEAHRWPIVVACEEIPGSKLNTIVTDNLAAAQCATQHLIDIGHKKIAHLASPIDNILYSSRHSGYLAAHKASGLPDRTEYTISGDFSLDSGAQAAKTLLSLEDPPTAVFCSNDEMAIGFISEASALGYKCPEDISVVGFDDIAVSSRITPPLTTIHQPRGEIGRLATERLIEILEGVCTSSEPERVVLKSELAVRTSTAPPKN